MGANVSDWLKLVTIFANGFGRLNSFLEFEVRRQLSEGSPAKRTALLLSLGAPLFDAVVSIEVFALAMAVGAIGLDHELEADGAHQLFTSLALSQALHVHAVVLASGHD